MKNVKVYRMRNGARNVVFDGRLATSMWERMRGLLGTSVLGEKEARVIFPCSSVHTFGMGYAIDIAFLDKTGRVIKCIEKLAPRRFAGAWSSRTVLEAAGGSFRCADIKTGDQIFWCTRTEQANLTGQKLCD